MTFNGKCLGAPSGGNAIPKKQRACVAEIISACEKGLQWQRALLVLAEMNCQEVQEWQGRNKGWLATVTKKVRIYV